MAKAVILGGNVLYAAEEIGRGLKAAQRANVVPGDARIATKLNNLVAVAGVLQADVETKGTRMTKDEKRKKYCSGCRNNFYNGNNSIGVKECWSLEGSEVVRRKFVHVDQQPPWNQAAEWTLSCCHRERYVAVNPEVKE